MAGFAQGGLVPSPGPAVLKIERLGQTADGRCLYSVNGGPPERIVSQAEARIHGRRVLDALAARLAERRNATWEPHDWTDFG